MRFAALAGHLTFIEQIEADVARGKTRREGLQTAGLKAGTEAEIPRLEKRRAFELKRLLAIPRPTASEGHFRCVAHVCGGSVVVLL